MAPVWNPSAGIAAVESEMLHLHAPDAHWLLVGGKTLLARASLWWQNTPPLTGERVGLIGHYGAIDLDAGCRMLNHACTQLQARGCTLAVGPMDGSTWRSYRLVTEWGAEPPFFLEPGHPQDWPGHFRLAGFSPLAHYSSAINEDLTVVDPRMDRVSKRMADSGVVIRPLAVGHVEEELRRIYALSLAAFAGNFLYTSIAEEEFLSLYRRLLPLIRPEMVLLAERGEQAAGFLLAIPDLLQARRGEAIDTVILKTVAVLPGRDYAGLGSLLATHCHQIALQMGYRRVIHALMHDTNNSRIISSRYGRTFRRYTLFARILGDSKNE